ncbi:MAG: DUF4124 domain-containing protein [Betaproteobacteria bacterium]|nr:DUF4124 domain-containing protein [Betaproteobacteria bacterium]
MDPRRSAKAFPGFAGLCIALGALLLPTHAASQAPSGRTIFRCETAGQISYTDAPCPDAEKVDAIRLPGVNRPAAPDRMAYHAPSDDGSGATWRPSAVKRPDGLAPRAARFAAGVNAECPHLAQRMALMEAEELVANGHNVGVIQERLAVQRHWYRQLGCATFAHSPGPLTAIRASVTYGVR